jgi:hypothetical protein
VKNKIEDLRNHLFATLEDLRDKDKPMDINRAKAIANVAAQIVNSAKVENDYARLTGGKGSGFIPDDKPELPGPGKEKVTVHRLRG